MPVLFIRADDQLHNALAAAAKTRYLSVAVLARSLLRDAVREHLQPAQPHPNQLPLPTPPADKPKGARKRKSPPPVPPRGGATGKGTQSTRRTKGARKGAAK